MRNLARDEIRSLVESDDPYRDLETVTDQVWQDLGETVPRPIVTQTFERLMANYDDATIRKYVPMLVRREATRLLTAVNPIEVEAKFKVANPHLFWRLQIKSELAGCVLSQPQTKLILDTYLDTRRRRILRAGFSCRQRETRDGIEMTLKSLDRAEGAIHRRSEWQASLSTPSPPSAWPESQVRKRVPRMIGTEPLLTLFKLEQTRIIRQMCRGNQSVAELSMDSVTVTTGEREQVFHGLEIELMPAVPESTLTEIVQRLHALWDLHPERLSKFERGLALVDADGQAQQLGE